MAQAYLSPKRHYPKNNFVPVMGVDHQNSMTTFIFSRVTVNRKWYLDNIGFPP